MFKRIAAGLLGGAHALNGLFMLTDSERWFMQVLSLAVEGERIAAVCVVSNPEKLAKLGPLRRT